MRIAFLAQPFDRMDDPGRGGSITLWTYYMAGECHRRGHEVTVIANSGERFRKRVRTINGVAYVHTPTWLDLRVTRIADFTLRILGRAGRSSGKRPSFSRAWHHGIYAWWCAREIRRRRCDRVHVPNYSQFIPVLRRLNPTVKISLHMHCEWLTQLDPTMVRKRLESVDVVIGCSDYITRKVAHAFAEAADRCATVPNAADVPTGGSSAAGAHLDKAILFVGRLSPEKGLHDLIQAFHLVLVHHPDARLLLVGGPTSAPLDYLVGLSDEPYVQSLKRFYPPTPDPTGVDRYYSTLLELAGKEVGHRIVFAGHLPHAEIAVHYEQAAILVNPSLSESFGIAPVEAMMRGVPVVATRVGGMHDTVVDGETGILVEPARPEALATALIELLDDPKKRHRMGAAGFTRAHTRFTWPVTASRFLQLMEARPRDQSTVPCPS